MNTNLETETSLTDGGYNLVFDEKRDLLLKTPFIHYKQEVVSIFGLLSFQLSRERVFEVFFFRLIVKVVTLLPLHPGVPTSYTVETRHSFIYLQVLSSHHNLGRLVYT